MPASPNQSSASRGSATESDSGPAGVAPRSCSLGNRRSLCPRVRRPVSGPLRLVVMSWQRWRLRVV